jgi:hypothetical protein
MRRRSTGTLQRFGWLPFVADDGSVDREDVLAPQKVAGLTEAIQVSTSEIMDDVDCVVRRNGTERSRTPAARDSLRSELPCEVLR